MTSMGAVASSVCPRLGGRRLTLIAVVMVGLLSGCTGGGGGEATTHEGPACPTEYPDGEPWQCTRDDARDPEDVVPAGWRCLSASRRGLNGWDPELRFLASDEGALAISFEGLGSPRGHIRLRVSAEAAGGPAETLDVRGQPNGFAKFEKVGTGDELSGTSFRYGYSAWAFESDTDTAQAFEVLTTTWTSRGTDRSTGWYALKSVATGGIVPSMGPAQADEDVVWLPKDTVVSTADSNFTVDATAVAGGFGQFTAPHPGTHAVPPLVDRCT